MSYRKLLYCFLPIILLGTPQGRGGDDAPRTAGSKAPAEISDDPKDVAVLRKIKFVYCQVDKHGNITNISWTSAATDRSEFPRVERLRHMRGITLSGHFSDDDLSHIEGFREIEAIDLSRTDVTDMGLAHLRSLTKLRVLYLAECKGVTDAGIAQLGGLVELERLYLRETPIHGEGFKSLQGLKKLRFMDLAYTGIDNDSLPIIAKLTALDDLNITATRVTDEGLPRLKPLTRLRYLWVGDMGPNRAGAGGWPRICRM